MSGTGSSPVVAPAYVFDIWGCRGSRNLEPGRSRLGGRTSCYSILAGDEILVCDAGRGLAALGVAMKQSVQYGSLRRIHILLSHAHMDHWEGLKDVDWFWMKDRPLEVVLHGPGEAIEAARAAFAHPSYVPLEQLTFGSDVNFRVEPMRAGDERTIGPFQIKTAPLNHYSGSGSGKRLLDTIGFRIQAGDGPVISYLSDHEPNNDTKKEEDFLISGSSLILVDAHFDELAKQAFGHGSIEFASRLARDVSGALVIAGHLGSLLRDEDIIAAVLRHAAGVDNCRIAREGDSYRWSAKEKRFAVRTFSRDAIPAIQAGGGLTIPEEIDILRHELRTPVSQILGYCDLLQQEMEAEGSTRHIDDLRRIERASQALLFYVDNISASDVKAASGGGAPHVGDAAASREPAAESADASPRADLEHVLVVDADEVNLDVISRKLRAQGYRVSVLSDGTRALQKIADEKPDAVILDVSIQGIGGMDVLRVMREQHAKDDLPVLMTMPRHESDEFAEALRLGANDCLTRPLSYPILLARLETIFSLRRSNQIIRRLSRELDSRGEH